MAEEDEPKEEPKKKVTAPSEAVLPVRATLMYVTEDGYDGFVEVRAAKLSTELLHQLEVAVKGVGGKPRAAGASPSGPTGPSVPYCPIHPDRKMLRSKKGPGYYCSYSWTDPNTGEKRYCTKRADENGNIIPPKEPGE
jgi:hypothetical protein